MNLLPVVYVFVSLVYSVYVTTFLWARTLYYQHYQVPIPRPNEMGNEIIYCQLVGTPFDPLKSLSFHQVRLPFGDFSRTPSFSNRADTLSVSDTVSFGSLCPRGSRSTTRPDQRRSRTLRLTGPFGSSSNPPPLCVRLHIVRDRRNDLTPFPSRPSYRSPSDVTPLLCKRRVLPTDVSDKEKRGSVFEVGTRLTSPKEIDSYPSLRRQSVEPPRG